MKTNVKLWQKLCTQYSYEQMEMPSVLFMIPVDWNHRTFVVSDF